MEIHFSLGLYPLNNVNYKEYSLAILSLIFLGGFFWGGGSSSSRIFHSYGDITITGEGFQISTYMYARHSWSVSTEGSLISVPHLLWHRTSIYNGHLQGPVTPTPVAEHLAVEMSLPVSMTMVCRGRDSNIQPSAPTHCATPAAFPQWGKKLICFVFNKWYFLFPQ